VLFRSNNIIKKGFYGKIIGHDAFYVNSPIDVSEIGESIYLSNPEEIVVVVFHYTDYNKIIFSLRSNSINVREIAERFGGGGHDHAAGFMIKEKTKDWQKLLKNYKDEDTIEKEALKDG
jgi:oligoribonuclease NrnB/cAMP/cGMP phosphodiesterase (DHH superfamily)